MMHSIESEIANWVDHAIFKNVSRPTQRAPDWWESARVQAGYVAWSWFRQNGVTSSRPPAGNASRWAVSPS